MKKIRPGLFYLSIGLNLILLSAIAFRYFQSSKKMTAQTQQYEDVRLANHNSYAAAKKKLFEMLPDDSLEIVFVGNSITEAFPLQEMFKGLNIKNRGVAGNTTLHVLNRLDEIVQSQPRKIFLQIGINDFLNGSTADATFSNFSKIAAMIAQKAPGCRLYVQSVFPTLKKLADNNSRIEQYNKMLKSYCSENKITYIDLYPAFFEGEGLKDSYTYDGVHLTGEGYFKWKSLIEGYVRE